jgi:hypothetical protein
MTKDEKRGDLETERKGEGAKRRTFGLAKPHERNCECGHAGASNGEKSEGRKVPKNNPMGSSFSRILEN